MVIGPNNSSDNRFGRRLRRMREDKGWTLAHVQESYGIDKAGLSRIERGDRTPDLVTLYRLREAYQVDDESFLTWLDMLHERDQPAQRHGSAV